MSAITGEALRAWRTRRGLSRAELARRLPAPYRTVESWEAGERTPPEYLDRALRDLEVTEQLSDRAKSHPSTT